MIDFISPNANNSVAFQTALAKLNDNERESVQSEFCIRYNIPVSSFDDRLKLTTRVSDTELAWMEKKVATYFQD